MSEFQGEMRPSNANMWDDSSDLPPNDDWTSKTAKSARDAPIPFPSSSILLISPTNRILLLHRVQTSTSFASAHVFPGGHVDPQDGELPPVDDLRRHEDSEPYRLAAIRECFEESGLLLARRLSDAKLIELSEGDKEIGRREVHAGKVSFLEWVNNYGGKPDIEGLIPFTRWLTPSNIPKRYTTQMYLYFLPIEDHLPSDTEKKQMHIPTPDGGVEHTAAQFLYAQEWLDRTISDEIILFPPQFFLLSLVADCLRPPSNQDELDISRMREQRDQLIRFVRTNGEPPWVEKCLSPNPIKMIKDQYMIMDMSDPGPELRGTKRKGDDERVLRVELTKDIDRGHFRPKPTQVLWREDTSADIVKSRL